MPDLTPQRLPILKAHRLPGLNLPESLIHPYYDGNSILNLPTTLCRLFHVPEIGHAPLAPEILTPLNGESGLRPKRVVLILMDALALQRLQQWMADGTAPVWQKFLGEAGVLAPITSVVPSTTSSALPTIWSGLSPAQHGMVGYELWLKEYGTVTNMITHSPMSIPGTVGSLERAGFKPETALPNPTLGQHLLAHGVQTHAFQHYTIARSGMSRIFYKDVNIHPFGTASEMWVKMRRLLENNAHTPLFTAAYWGHVDHLSHLHGPDSEYPAAEFATFSAAFEQHFLRRLSPELRKDTLLILTADHGQITTPKAPRYLLTSHPQLARSLPIMPTGENRLVYFYIRPGQTEAVRAYLNQAFKKQFIQLDPEHVIKTQLFGPGVPHPRLRERLGDLIALPRDSAYLWWSQNENPLLGRHGGMTAQEMLVPFLAARL